MKLNWKYVLGLCILCLVLGMTICQREFKPQIVKVYTADTIVEYVYKDTTVITDTIIISDTDTLYIDSTTSIGQIPIRTHRQEYIRILLSGKNRFSLKQLIETDYRGIIYAQRMLPGNDTFNIELPGEKAIRLWGSAGLGYMNGGCIPVIAELGIMAKKRYSLSGIILRTDETYYGGMFKVWF